MSTCQGDTGADGDGQLDQDDRVEEETEVQLGGWHNHNHHHHYPIVVIRYNEDGIIFIIIIITIIPSGTTRMGTTSTSPTSKTGLLPWVTLRRTSSRCTATSWRTSATCSNKNTRWLFLSSRDCPDCVCQSATSSFLFPAQSFRSSFPLAHH